MKDRLIHLYQEAADGVNQVVDHFYNESPFMIPIAAIPLAITGLAALASIKPEQSVYEVRTQTIYGILALQVAYRMLHRMHSPIPPHLQQEVEHPEIKTTETKIQPPPPAQLSSTTQPMQEYVEPEPNKFDTYTDEYGARYYPEDEGHPNHDDWEDLLFSNQ